MYKVIFDNGKSYEEYFNNEIELKESLERFYFDNRDSGYYYDIAVLNEKNEDISESQFIQEMIMDILNDCEE